MTGFLIFHLWVKYPLFSLFPGHHQQRIWYVMSYAPSLSRTHLAKIIVSLLAGTGTHIVWDSCTHWYGWTVQHVDLFHLPLLTTSRGTLRLYKELQHGGTILGTLVLMYWYIRWLNMTPTVAVPSRYSLHPAIKRRFLIGCGGAAEIGGMLYGYMNMSGYAGIQSFGCFVASTVRAGFAILLIESLLFSLWWQFIRRSMNALSTTDHTKNSSSAKYFH